MLVDLLKSNSKGKFDTLRTLILTGRDIIYCVGARRLLSYTALKKNLTRPPQKIVFVYKIVFDECIEARLHGHVATTFFTVNCQIIIQN